ncbi:MAG TPA: hypothetical protein VJ486_00590 [Geothrix sp.]|nr:hypothetical protein [Geothrix sp.]
MKSRHLMLAVGVAILGFSLGCIYPEPGDGRGGERERSHDHEREREHERAHGSR